MCELAHNFLHWLCETQPVSNLFLYNLLIVIISIVIIIMSVITPELNLLIIVI